MKTILELIDDNELASRGGFRGTRTKFDGDATIYDTFVSGEYNWDGNRYIYDFTRCSAKDGWLQYDTDQDAHYFGVWYHMERRVTCTYVEGDESIVVCTTDEAWKAELKQMADFYGDPPPAFTALGLDGSVTHYIDENARPELG